MTSLLATDGGTLHARPAPPVNRSLRCGLVALIVFGTLLRVWQFSANNALWLDELAIARNVIERSTVSLLTSPLDFDQSAPKGFLATEKLAVAVGGPHELALRAWPLVASIASLVLLAMLAVRILDALGAMVAVAGLAFAIPLIMQAAEVKQYSSDVTVALVLMLLALPRAIRRPRDEILAGVSGAVAIWFSQPAVLVAGALALIVAHRAWRCHAKRRPLEGVWLVALWLASASIAALSAMQSMTPDTTRFMQQFWIGGFPPEDVAQAIATWWPWPAIYELFGSGAPGFRNTLGYPLPMVYAVLSLLGLVMLVLRRHDGWVVVLPVLVTIAAAAARQYPFRDRLILFLLPSFFIGLGVAVSTLHERVTQRHLAIAVAITAVVCAGLLTPPITSRPPYTIEDVKPVMSALQAGRMPSDAIYVHANAASAFTYYAPRYGMVPTSFTIGSCHFVDGRAFLRELDQFRGLPRVWVVVTHIIPALAGERLDLLGYLDAIGQRRTSITVPSTRAGPSLPAESILYDLSDSERLQRTTAATFQLQGTYARTERACHEGPISMVFGRAR